MTARAYYNEIDPYAAQWLRNLISAGHIAPGDVDERSIVDVQPDDLKGYRQCHFFAGIGGWSLAARMAGWPDDRPLWTGSCPCQPFSVIGKHEGEEDERHLWPTFFSLISARRPAVVMGEQVAAAVGKDWLDGVHSDLESIGYACGATVVPACSVDAPHRRDRLWFVADAARDDERRTGKLREGDQPQIPTGRLRHACPACGGSGRCGPYWPGGLSTICGNCNVDHSVREGLEGQRGDGHDLGKSRRIETEPFGSASPAGGALPDAAGKPGWARLRQDRSVIDGAVATHGRRNSTAWSGAEWALGADGKARRVEPGIRLLAHGVPARVGRLRAYGNAIVPQVAAEVIGAYMDSTPTRSSGTAPSLDKERADG